MLDLASLANGLVQQYGLLALFLLMALESSMILNFLPGEAVVTLAAVMLATSAATLAAVVLVSAVGATVGALGLYALTRAKGRPFLTKHGPRVGLDAAREAKIEAWFARPRGERLVFFLRFVPFLRALVSVPAGLARMEPRRFIAYTLVGSILFNGALAMVGVLARDANFLPW